MESSPQGTVIELRRLHSSCGGSRFFLILSFLVVERNFLAPDPIVDANLLLSTSPLLLLLLLLCMQAWPVVEGLQLEVTGRTTKCIVEDIQTDVLVIDDYKVISTSQDDLSVTTRLIFDRSFLSSSFVLVNPFCIPCQGHLVATVECKKYPCGCLSHLPCHVLRLCFLPLCTARCHRTGRCTFLVLNMASSVRISSKPRMIPVSSLNGMEAFSRQNMLANTIEFRSVFSVLGKTMLTRFYFFLPRFFLGFSFSESSLFFVSLVLSFFRRLLGGPH